MERIVEDHELIVNSFCGGGGATLGQQLALGRPVDIAINHDEDSIKMHRLNHPETKHYCEDAWLVDPVKACAGRPVGHYWTSPDCTDHSIAKGDVPKSQNIRSHPWLTVYWPLHVPVRMIDLENVAEIEEWGPLDSKGKPIKERRGETWNGFILAMTTGLPKDHPSWKEAVERLQIKDKPHLQKRLNKGLGYDLEYKVLVMSEYGVPTSRKRLFLKARNDGKPITWPEVTHGPEGSGLMPYRTAAECIDWTLPSKSIFGRKRPLVKKTLVRLATGLQRFVLDTNNPFIAPLNTSSAFITEHANSSNQRNMRIDQPLRTVCAQVKGGHFGLVAPIISRQFGKSVGHQVDAPLGTITAGGSGKSVLVSAFISKYKGSNTGHRADEPLHTITAGGNHYAEVRAHIMKYNNNNLGHPMNHPLQTISCTERFARVDSNITKGFITEEQRYDAWWIARFMDEYGPKPEIVKIGQLRRQYIEVSGGFLTDIKHRMLAPKELYTAHSFPQSYKFEYDENGKWIPKAKQVARVGNSVPPEMARLLVLQNGSERSVEAA